MAASIDRQSITIMAFIFDFLFSNAVTAIIRYFCTCNCWTNSSFVPRKHTAVFSLGKSRKLYVQMTSRRRPVRGDLKIKRQNYQDDNYVFKMSLFSSQLKSWTSFCGLLLILNKFHTLFCCYCWLWTGKCLLRFHIEKFVFFRHGLGP